MLVVAAVAMWWCFGLLRVPEGMDTMPLSHPEGAVCLIQKRPWSVSPGAVVFLDLPDGSTVLTRVVSVSEDGELKIRHDNRSSRFVGLERGGPYRIEDVRGVVITAFVSKAQDAPRAR